jgi:PPM family protein phosphatase
MAGTLRIAGAQHAGSRHEQQDAWDSLATGPVVFAAMADGMGGMEGGQHASAAAIAESLKWCADNTEPLLQRLVRAQLEACNAVRLEARQRSLEGEMGSTLLLAAVDNGKLLWSSSGDSRIYLVRQSRPLQLTRDHTYGAQLARCAAADGHAPGPVSDSERRQLTSWLGINDLREIDSPEEAFALQYGDRVLLLSDGCYDALPDTIPEAESPHVLAEKLVDLAISRNLAWQDNATCMVLQWTEK